MKVCEKKIKVGLTTLGCKVNQCDTAAIVRDLQNADFTLVPFSTFADAYVINTCTVTAFADFQARQLIRRALRLNPRARVIVTGCYAQTRTQELADTAGVTVVVGNDQKHRIADLLSQPSGDWPPVLAGDIFQQGSFPAAPPSGLAGRTRAFFKIQDGCNAFCSYCIVPFARGKSRSLPLSDLFSGTREFIRQGFREIVLTGIHLGDYGKDLQPRTNLARTLETLLSEDANVRFRLSSIEPNEISDELLDAFSRHDNLCPHLHIPLQSGDDSILKKMKRSYDRRFYQSLIHKLARTVKDISVGVDVMVGFPGEGEKEFGNTLSLLEDLPVGYFHVFPYSERPGTDAQNLMPKVPDKIKKERAAILRDLGRRKREDFSRMFLGKILPVLVEQTQDRKTGLPKGFSHNYLPVILDKQARSLVNTIVRVRIDEYRDGKLTGQVVYE